jgi:decaprenyl-phosphate phosphoribosyltransferase
VYNATILMESLGKLQTNLLNFARLARSYQWTKNLVIFAAIIFSGKLFNADLLVRSFFAFVIFCCLSSTSYIINDLIDAPEDRRHPIKKYRPIASGAISARMAILLAIALVGGALILALTFDISFFLLCVTFLFWQILYSTVFKSYAVVDLFAISASFMMRAFAGRMVTGYHIPVWLFLTIFFMSLFIAAVKRNAELSLSGSEARHTLAKYNKSFLDFLTYTFATTTIIAYSLYSYLEQPPNVVTSVSIFIGSILSGIEGRKLMTLTIPLVVYAIARYGQLFYTRIEGERPEKIIISDGPLIGVMILWGMMVVSFIYLL